MRVASLRAGVAIHVGFLCSAPFVANAQTPAARFVLEADLGRDTISRHI